MDGGLNTGVDKTLEDFDGDTQQRDGLTALWVPWGLIWLKDCNNWCSSPDLGDLEVAQAGREEFTQPGLHLRAM